MMSISCAAVKDDSTTCSNSSCAVLLIFCATVVRWDSAVAVECGVSWLSTTMAKVFAVSFTFSFVVAVVAVIS